MVGFVSEDWEYAYWSCPNGKLSIVKMMGIAKTSEMIPCFGPQDCI